MKELFELVYGNAQFFCLAVTIFAVLATVMILSAFASNKDVRELEEEWFQDWKREDNNES